MYEKEIDGFWVPNYPNSTSKGLIILLHGYGDNGGNFSQLAIELAHLIPEAAFVSLQAPEPHPMLPDARQWFPLETISRTLLAPGARHAGSKLAARIGAIGKARNFANKDIAIVGFSQGAIMAYEITLNSPVNPGALVCCSGMIADVPSEPRNCTDIPPTLILHGALDSVIPADAARHSEKQLRTYGASLVVRKEFIDLDHEIDNRIIVAIAQFLQKHMSL